MEFIPIILCGGSGSRLYPLSRKTFPKQFIKINNDKSLLQNTLLRFAYIQQIVLITNSSHKNIVNSQIKELFNDGLLNDFVNIIIFLEPEGRNTLPAITLVSHYFLNKKLLFIPCDHIYDTQSLINCINLGLEHNNDITIFGITPTYPETGFGYIEIDPVSEYVNKFIEKPNEEKAKELLQNKNIYWNSGIFLLNTTYFLKLVQELKSELHNTIVNLINIENRENNLLFVNIDVNYSSCENISIDYGIIEKIETNQIYMIKYNNLWNDIGSFKSMYDISLKNENGINKCAHTLTLDSNNCYVNSNKLVLLNNISNISIIDTNDVLLISDISKTQEVKKLYELAISLNKKETTFNHFDYRPWGFYEVLAGGDNMGFKIKKIIVYPNMRLSLQSHNHRKEYWFCINGQGQAQIDSNIYHMNVNSMVFIDQKILHRLYNNGNTNLTIIEIQLGTYLGEDDITRYEDDFNRT
jgi:mannose-1-phosphate guanylyltransferase/mannose-6-phosphate isomerase